MAHYVLADLIYFVADISDDQLVREMRDRIACGQWKPQGKLSDVEPWTRGGLAADIREAYYARNASRLEALLTVLEQREQESA